MAVALDDATVAFGIADNRIYTAVEKATLRVADGEFVAIVGPTGCWQIHTAQCRCRSAGASLRCCPDIWSAAGRTERTGGLPVSGRRAVSLEDRARQCRHRTGDRQHSARRGAGAGAGLVDLGGSRRLRRALSAYAVGRPAQARRSCAGADPQSENSADGRAVRPARCADPAGDGQPAAGSVEQGSQGGAVRHPRSRRGNRAGRPCRHHVSRAGLAHHRRLEGAAAAAARYFRSAARQGFSRASSRDLERAEGRSDEGLCAVRWYGAAS